jgi:ATP-dependent Clp protease ATP-binding subunit ClpA
MAEQHLCQRPGRRGPEELGRDLTREAREGKLDPVIDRADEIPTGSSA